VIAVVLSLLLASALADDILRSSSVTLRHARDIHDDQLHPRRGELIQEAAKREGCSVSQFVREAALIRASRAVDHNLSPMRGLAAQLRAIGDRGYALAEKGLQVAKDEAGPKR
jgi:hypothetical protein